MRKGRPSLTASLVAAVRALHTELPDPLRVMEDPLAKDLVPLALRLPVRAVARVPWAAPAVHRALGTAVIGLTYHVALRTRAIDDALRASVRQGTRQLVLLGAGLDTRAQRMTELGEVRVFEVDHPAMQETKRARLARAGGATTRVIFTPVDFERDRLETALLEAGFSAGEPSFWIWEGVTVYLTPDAIGETLGAIGRLSAQGSGCGITYTRPDSVGALEPIARALASVIGEPIRGMLSSDELRLRLDRAGFAVVSDESDTEWADRYWGSRPPRLREWERLVVAEKRLHG